MCVIEGASMKLSFNLENINYLELTCVVNSKVQVLKLAVKEKREYDFHAVVPNMGSVRVETPQEVLLKFVCKDGVYKTNTTLKEVLDEGENTCFVIENPKSLDYQQNREYFRILAEYECVYTVETEDGVESLEAKTYDISAGGVSIIVNKSVFSTEETSILIMADDRHIRSHLKFIRCEAFDSAYKISFEFTDLAEADFALLSEMCINAQLKSF